MQRKYFGTDGIRGKVGVWPITAEFALKLGWAVGKMLARTGGGKVLIGKDTRISGYMLESVLEAGLTAAGIDVHLLGPMPTPAIAYLTRTLRAQTGIVISASHNPYYDNGIKFFSSQGYKLPDNVELEIEEQLQQTMTTVDSAELGKAVRIVDAPGRYIEFCKSTAAVDTRLNGLKIVVDCANGATYHIAPNVFRELGAEVIELGVEPNGLNINLECGATKPQALRARVIQEQADLGVAFDGDGDRVIMVDHQGNVLDGDALIYIITRYRLNLGTLKGGVVGTVMTNLALEEFLAAQQIDFTRVAVGDQHVMAELVRKKWHIGGEPSGHIVCTDNSTTGDGIISALQVLSAMCHHHQSLASLCEGFNKYPQVVINVNVMHQYDPSAVSDIQREVIKVQNALGKKSRVLIRCSGTEPLVRVMVEGEDASLVQKYAELLAHHVKESI